MELEMITDEEIFFIEERVDEWFENGHPMFDASFGNRMILREFLANAEGKTHYKSCVGREF